MKVLMGEVQVRREFGLVFGILGLGRHGVMAAVFLLLALPAAGQSRPGDVFRDCAVCPEMVVVPGGTFMMGSRASEAGRHDDEGPRHKVTIPRFAVGRYEVTYDEWKACEDAGGCPDDEGSGRGRRPVVNVSWKGAKLYAIWLLEETGEEYRLLSESEWEYAARGGTTTAYHWGNDVGRGNANCDGCGSAWGGVKAAPVGRFPANQFGLHDMSGNVWEWVEDCWHKNYEGAPSDGGAWTSGGDCGKRVLRAGSWLNEPEYVRSANRDWLDTGHRFNRLGFRIARTLP